MQTRKKLKPFVIPVIYSIVTITMLISLMFLIQNLLNVNKNPLTYITSGTIAEDIVPVVSEKKTIIRPYTDQDVKIVQNFYDYKGEKQNQENSLIFYENTYLQNSGVDYGKGSTFDVVAILEGTVIKVKQDGRRDSLANCPTNPIVDNANECTINDINKQWYIDFANEKYIKFIGGRLLEEYKKEELLDLAKELNIDIDKKTKKEDLIKIIKEHKKILTNNIQYDNINNVKGDEINMTKQELEEKLQKSMEQNEKLVEKLKEKESEKPMKLEDFENERLCSVSLLKKINEFRKEIRKIEFIFDKELPSNLGGGEYYSIDQFYNAVQDTAIKVGLDFSFEITDVISFEKELVKPSGKLPIHVATVETLATFTDLDTGVSKEYITIAQGSDTIDKAISGAGTLAFRQWFYKNFTPKNMNEEELDKKEEVEKSEAPKVPVYIPGQKKEEIKKEVVKQEQHEESDDEDIKEICENIMKVREKINDDTWGANTLEKIMSGKCTSVDLMEIDLKVKNKMEKVGL